MHHFNPWHHVAPEYNEDIVNGIIEIPQKATNAWLSVFWIKRLGVIRSIMVRCIGFCLGGNNCISNESDGKQTHLLCYPIG